ncbi:MAG: hypothetical protein Q7S36_03755 [Candidatus Liptonbacteria bacterium]|nr:hypothetical protein [Candidatus Liptonbacteria bacterium]
MSAKYSGYIENYYTGSLGLSWVLYEDVEGKMVKIENGDNLKIFGEKGRILFEGEIQEDTKTGWAECPTQPGSGIGQPSAFGFWIRWTQAGWKPNDWAALFMHEPPYRAELIKKNN